VTLTTQQCSASETRCIHVKDTTRVGLPTKVAGNRTTRFVESEKEGGPSLELHIGRTQKHATAACLRQTADRAKIPRSRGFEGDIEGARFL
jgi:hypothetical protein